MKLPYIHLTKKEDNVIMAGYLVCGTVFTLAVLVFHNERIAFGFGMGMAWFWFLKALSVDTGSEWHKKQ